MNKLPRPLFRHLAALGLAFLAPAAWADAADDYARVNFAPSEWGAVAAEVARSIDAVSFLLLVLAIVALGMAVDLLAHLRVGKMVPEGLLADVQEEMANGEYEKALEMCEKTDCLIGQIFAAALTKTDYSFERMEEALRSEADIQSLVWRQWVGQFRAVAIIGPMAGIIGALVTTLRLVSDFTGRPDFGLALASLFEMRALVYGICLSLIIGLAISIFGLAVYYFSSIKLEKILIEARRLGEELLDPFRPLPMPPEE